MRRSASLLRAMLALFTISLLLSQWPTPTTATPTPAAHVVANSPAPTDRLIVQLRNTSADPQLAATLVELADVELSYVRPMGDGAHIFALAEALPQAEVETLAQRLSADPEVLFAEPDSLLFPTLEPTDPLYQQFGWPLWPVTPDSYGINLPTAWELTTGDPNIVVAVLDTGGLLSHEDLTGRSLSTNPGYDMVSNLARAGDGDGRDPDPSDPGDFVTASEVNAGGSFADCPVVSSSWHGSHVAGIIGATANNNRGIAGINWRSPLLHVRVLSKCGGYVSDITDGIRWAIGTPVFGVPDNPNPARVLNLSLGGPGACSMFFQQAIDEANRRGAVVVVAAGNSSEPASEFQPGNCQGTLTVAAIGRSGWRAHYSNYGSPVAIAAPGGDRSQDTMIYSTINSGQYGPVADSYYPYQGTSMATPHVAGVASLMLAVNPTLGAGELLSIMQATATPFPPNSNCIGLCGAGVVNAGAAVVEAARRNRPLEPGAALSATSLSFGPQQVGTSSPPQLLTLSNTGNTTLTVHALSLSGPFRQTGGSCLAGLPLNLAVGASCTLEVSFTPTAAIRASGTLSISSNASATPMTVGLFGIGTAPALGFGPLRLDFGTLPLGASSPTRPVTITNPGTAPLRLDAITLSPDFRREGGSCAEAFPATLGPGMSCTILVSFTPDRAVPYEGLLSVASNVPDGPYHVRLYGTGQNTLASEPEFERTALVTDPDAEEISTFAITDLNLEVHPGRVTLRFALQREATDEGERSLYYAVTAERAVPDANLVVALASLSLAPDEQRHEFELTFDRLSLVAVDSLALSLEAEAGAQLARAVPLRIALPAEIYSNFLPLVQR
jgi:subtilisin family serine protease